MEEKTRVRTVSQELVQFFIIADGELEVTRNNARRTW